MPPKTPKDLGRIEAKQDMMSGKLESLALDASQQRVRIDGIASDVDQIKGAIDKTSGYLQTVGDRLGEYNGQLQLHIAGVNALKEQNVLLKEQMDTMKTESNARLEKLEKPYKWIEGTAWVGKQLGKIIIAGAAFYGAVMALGKAFGLW